MPSETTVEKAHRLLREGRLIVWHAGDPDHPGWVAAECRGDSGMVYTLGYHPDSKEWLCSCAARKGTCSHLQALKLVVVVS